jgi:hypothetical protein
MGNGDVLCNLMRDSKWGLKNIWAYIHISKRVEGIPVWETWKCGWYRKVTDKFYERRSHICWCLETWIKEGGKNVSRVTPAKTLTLESDPWHILKEWVLWLVVQWVHRIWWLWGYPQACLGHKEGCMKVKRVTRESGCGNIKKEYLFKCPKFTSLLRNSFWNQIESSIYKSLLTVVLSVPG